MFPEMAPATEDNQEAVKALDSNAPVVIESSVPTEEALDFLDRLDSGVLGIDDLVIGDI